MCNLPGVQQKKIEMNLKSLYFTAEYRKHKYYYHISLLTCKYIHKIRIYKYLYIKNNKK